LVRDPTLGAGYDGKNGYQSTLSAHFTAGHQVHQAKYIAALEEVKKNPSDPVALANFQAVAAERALHLQAQSTAGKKFADVAAGTIRNWG